MTTFQIIIDSWNEEKYTEGNYPEIISIIWTRGKLKAKVLKNFPNLIKFECINQDITDLSPLQCCKKLRILICNDNKIINLISLQHCTELIHLNCNFNRISGLGGLEKCIKLDRLEFKDNLVSDLSPLEQCKNLTVLDCEINRIEDLSPLQDCTGLTHFWFSKNLVADLSPLQGCTRLIELCFADNLVKNISPLQSCKNLYKLFCINNEISDLSPLRGCIGLKLLWFSYNKITDLSPLQGCRGLIELNCSHNKIESLDILLNLNRLIYFTYGNNPLNPPSIQVIRALERIERNLKNNNNSIYNDTQNVHDVTIQQSVMDSVRKLMNDKLPNNKEIKLDFNSVFNSELKDNTKNRLVEYFQDNTQHSIFLITYKELFTYVWNRIINNPNKRELLKILDANIQDSECSCFTGRFNRTLSTLVGFYDDIQINISDNSRINAIILQVKDTIKPYDPVKHKELVRTALLEAGYDSEVIKDWIEYIE